MPSIAALISVLIGIFAFMLLFPAIVAFAGAEWHAFGSFLFLSLFYGFIAVLLFLTTASQFKPMDRLEVFYATILMWLVFVILAVAPFLIIEELEIMQAIFEAVSASVTLGVSLVPLDNTSLSMKLYRSLVAWQGGLLTLIFAVYVLGRYQVGGTPNSQLRYILHSSQSGDPRIMKTFFEIFVPYMALTIVCAAILVIVRVNPVDALLISLNILSTNGYFPVEAGSSILNNFLAEIVLLIFMIVGATSIIWHRIIFIHQWQKSKTQIEASIFLGLILAVSILAFIGKFFAQNDNFSIGNAILSSIFDVVSIMTTTGITYDNNYGISLPLALILVLSLVGGCSYSTSGGFKIFRLWAMVRHSANEIKKLIYPHIIIAKYSNIDEKERKNLKAIWSILFISIISIMGAALMFALYDYDLPASLTLAIGAFSSSANLIIMGIGDNIPIAPSNMVLAIISFLALAARIELLVLLAIIGRLRW